MTDCSDEESSMATLDSVTQDHQLISKVLDALEVFTRRLRKKRELDRDQLRRFTTFFVSFADIHHASKEEQVLFPALERHGARWDHGPLADARREHRQERYLMRTMAQLAAQDSTPDDEALRHMTSELDEFITSMRAHIQKEDYDVMPLVASMDEAARRDLEERLHHFDSTPPSRDDIPKMRELAESLSQAHSSDQD
jgi:hemerythrin-like domain-containing protein